MMLLIAEMEIAMLGRIAGIAQTVVALLLKYAMKEAAARQTALEKNAEVMVAEIFAACMAIIAELTNTVHQAFALAMLIIRIVMALQIMAVNVILEEKMSVIKEVAAHQQHGHLLLTQSAQAKLLPSQVINPIKPPALLVRT